MKVLTHQSRLWGSPLFNIISLIKNPQKTPAIWYRPLPASLQLPTRCKLDLYSSDFHLGIMEIWRSQWQKT
jgi:hypothetical protein